MQSGSVLLLLALAWPAVGSKLPRSPGAKDVIADEEDVNPADLGAVQAYLQELEAAHHAERVKQLKRDKAAVPKRPFKISDELDALRNPSPSPAPALRKQRSGISRAPRSDELVVDDNSIDALTKLGSDAGPYRPSIVVEGAKTGGAAKEAGTTRVTDKETDDLLRIVSQASPFEHSDETALPIVSAEMPDVTAGLGSKLEAAGSDAALALGAVQPEAKSGAEPTGIENQLARLIHREEDEDAEVIVRYIKHNNEEGLQEKIRSMSEHGGTARIHAAALAMQAMGYTDDIVSKWLAEKDAQAEISEDIKETGSSSAEDAKVLFRLMKHHNQQELRNAVSTLFRYGGSERVKRAQSVLDMWLHKHTNLPGPAKLASASPHLPSSPTSPLVIAAESQAKTETVEKTSPSVKAAVLKFETGEGDNLAAVKEELAKADASEMSRLVKNKDTKGLYAFFGKLQRSVGGDERLKLAKREFDQQEDQTKQKQKQLHKVALKSPNAAKAVAHQGHQPSEHVPKRNLKSAIAGILREQKKQLDKSVLTPDRQASIDAAIMMKHAEKGNKETLQGVYGELFAHGGTERIQAAQAVIKQQAQQPSEGQDAIRQQSATIAFALQGHQDGEQTQIDGAMLVKLADKKDYAGLQKYYSVMDKTGLQRVRAAEALAERMTKSSRTQQTTPAMAELSPEQAKADAEKLVSYESKKDFTGMQGFYSEMEKTGPERVHAAEVLAESVKKQEPTSATASFASPAHQNGEVAESSQEQAKADAEKMVSYVNKKDYAGMQGFYIEMGKTGPERVHAAEVLADDSLGSRQTTSATASFASQAHRDREVADSSQEQAKADAEKMVTYFKKKDFAGLQRLESEMRKTGPERVHAAEALAERIAG